MEIIAGFNLLLKKYLAAFKKTYKINFYKEIKYVVSFSICFQQVVFS